MQSIPQLVNDLALLLAVAAVATIVCRRFKQPLVLGYVVAGFLVSPAIGWIQNRAFTLAIWCMFAQCVPAFQDYSVFSVQSVNNPNVNLAVSVIALLANIAAFAYIMYRAKKLKVNPYMNEVFAGTKDYDKAMARRATPAELAES